MLNKKPNTKNLSEGNWFKRHKIWTAVIAVVLLIGFVGAVNDMSNLEQSNDQSNKQDDKAEQETAKEEKPQEQQPAESLATRSENALKTELQVTNFSEILSNPDRDPTSPLGYISGFEDVNGSTVRVNIQASLDKDEANNAGRIIFGLFGLQVMEVDTLVVRDSSGVDKANVYRQNVPVLNVNN